MKIESLNRRAKIITIAFLCFYSALFLLCGICILTVNQSALRVIYGSGVILLWLGISFYLLFMLAGSKKEDPLKKGKYECLARFLFFGSFVLFGVLILWLERYLDSSFTKLDFSEENSSANSAYFFLGLIAGIFGIVTRLLKGSRNPETYNNHRYVTLRTVPLLLVWVLVFLTFLFGQIYCKAWASPVGYLWIPSLLMFATILSEYLTYSKNINRAYFVAPFFAILLSFALLGLFF